MPDVILRASRAPWLPPGRLGSLRSALLNGRRVLPPGRCAGEEEGEEGRLDVLLSGVAYRCAHLRDGRRQIASVVLPGDACGFSLLHGVTSGTTLVAASSCVIGSATEGQVRAIAEGEPDVLRALWWEAATEHASQVGWTVSLGCRTALERMCHLYHDAYVRLDAVGLVFDGQFVLPLTQEDVGARTGMTSVHVNRLLRTLREIGAVEVRGRNVRVDDVRALADRAGIDDAHAHAPRRWPARPAREDAVVPREAACVHMP